MPLRWSPPVELSRSAELVIKRCSKRELFMFLRRHRHEILDDEMQSACTGTKRGGRSLAIHDNEPFLLQLRAARKTPEGRLRARDRIHVEHGLARLASRSGRRARYRGLRKKLLDQRRHAALVNVRALASLAV